MADGIEFDISGLDDLVADITSAPRKAKKNIVAAVKVSSLKIKRSWQEPLRGSQTLRGLPYAVNFDVDVSSHSVESEIGFDKEKPQGALGNISEFGSIKIAPRGFGLQALQKNLPDFEFGITKAVDDALREDNL